jgi:hypothetical protein
MLQAQVRYPQINYLFVAGIGCDNMTAVIIQLKKQ